MPDKPHHLPAALIGGFGDPRPAAGLRYARVSVRRKNPDKILTGQAAQAICYEYGLYEVINPSPTLPADYAEQWWRTYEGALPKAIHALEAGTAGADEWKTVLLHVQAAWPRHPDFERDVNEQKAAKGQPPVAGDDLEQLRKTVLDENRTVMARSRFALLRRDRHAGHLLINDKGFASFGDHEAGIFFPLSREIGVLMAVGKAQPGDDYEKAPYAEREVNARGVRLLNELSWDHVGIRCAIAHQDDEQDLRALVDHGRRFVMKNRYLRPYRHTRELRLLDWA